ncbi:MAG: hypothetical protein Q9187_004971 [Circinaria calcarea]
METLSSRVNMWDFQSDRQRLHVRYFKTGAYNNWDAEIAHFENAINKVRNSSGPATAIHLAFDNILVSKGMNVFYSPEFQRAFDSWMNLPGEQETFKGLDVEKKFNAILGWARFVDNSLPDVRAVDEVIVVDGPGYGRAMTGKDL